MRAKTYGLQLTTLAVSDAALEVQISRLRGKNTQAAVAEWDASIKTARVLALFLLLPSFLFPITFFFQS